MVTWLNFKLIASFPLVLFLFFFLPFALPALSYDFVGDKTISMAFLAMPREWLLNIIVLPLLPYETANALAQWWQQTNYGGEVALQALISLNLYLPFAFLQFGLLELRKQFLNWWSKRRFDSATELSRKA